MLQVILFVSGVMGVLVLVMAYMSRGRRVAVPMRALDGLFDPLTLDALSEKMVGVRLAVPTSNYGQEVVELEVNESTRDRLLTHGPIAFAGGLSELAHSSGGYFVDSRQLRQPLDRLREKLFGDDDVYERICLIHDMTETDFVLLYEESEDAIRAHFGRCGFAPLNEG